MKIQLLQVITIKLQSTKEIEKTLIKKIIENIDKEDLPLVILLIEIFSLRLLPMLFSYVIPKIS